MHYICEGSDNGVSDTPGSCTNQACTLYQHPLTPCDCTDGKHYGKQLHEIEPPPHQEEIASA